MSLVLNLCSTTDNIIVHMFYTLRFTKYASYFIQERGENLPPEDSFEVARKIKEMYSYTCSDIVKVNFLPSDH